MKPPIKIPPPIIDLVAFCKKSLRVCGLEDALVTAVLSMLMFYLVFIVGCVPRYFNALKTDISSAGFRILETAYRSWREATRGLIGPRPPLVHGMTDAVVKRAPWWLGNSPRHCLSQHLRSQLNSMRDYLSRSSIIASCRHVLIASAALVT